jgi:hypothetical protein
MGFCTGLGYFKTYTEYQKKLDELYPLNSDRIKKFELLEIAGTSECTRTLMVPELTQYFNWKALKRERKEKNKNINEQNQSNIIEPNLHVQKQKNKCCIL